MARGLIIGSGIQPYTLQSNPGRFHAQGGRAAFTAPIAAPGFPNISINGNRFIAGVGGVGSPINLWGANLSALEFVGVQQFGNVSQWGGVIPAWSVLATWGGNCYRVPWNSQSLLGLSARPAHSQNATAWTGPAVSADPQGNYTQTLIDAAGYIQQTLQSYVNFDLHWTCPSNITLGGVTANVLADGQPMFTDYSTGYPAYQKLFSLFGNGQPGQTTSWGYVINNNGIMFEAQNEPYLTDNGYGAGSASLINLMLNGGNVSKFSWAINSYSINQTIQMLGNQQILNLLRTYGTNPLGFACDAFSQDSSYALSIMPVDSLPIPQVFFCHHCYPSESSGNYNDNNIYGSTGNDKFASPTPYTGTNWSIGILKVLAAGVPVFFTEDGDNCGPGASGASAPLHVQNCIWPFCAANNCSWTGWQWNNAQSSSYASFTGGPLYPYMTTGTNSAPTPIFGYGVATKAQLLAHP